MRRKKCRLLAFAGAAVLAVECLACCGEKDSADRTGQGAELSGTIQLVGSTSMSKLAVFLAESFMDQYPDVTVAVEMAGSGAGIEAVASGRADIGNASRKLKGEEKARGVVENVVALDGIAVCVDTGNTVKGLTGEQLADIYTGAVTRWAQLGGEDFPIVVVGREAGSGTRMAFEESLKIEDVCVYANELDSTGAVMARVASTPGAIGYISLDVADASVRIMPLGGVEPTAENIRSGRYPLSRPLVMATRGEISAQSVLIQAWFGFVYGEEGQGIVERLGLTGVEPP